MTSPDQKEQPEWIKLFDDNFDWMLKYISQTENFEQMKSFISQQIQKAKEEERGRIRKIVKHLKIKNDSSAGAGGFNTALQEVLDKLKKVCP